MTRLLRTLPLVALLAIVLAAPAAAYKVAPTPPPGGYVGVPYSFTFKAEGGSEPHKFKVDSGSFPPGLVMSDEGVVSGTPTASGSFKFYVKAVDATGLHSEVEFTITIRQKLTVTTSGLPDATVGVPYTTQLGTSGGTATGWRVSQGALPPGLTLTSGGVLQGTPTALGAATFTVSATMGSQTDTKQLTLVVRAPLTVSTAALPPAIVGRIFTTQLSAAGGSGGYSYTVAGGTLPPGLVLDGTTGVIEGTPRSAGAFTTVIGVTAAGGGAAQQSLRLVVRRQVAIVTTSLPGARVGGRYAARIVVAGGVAPVELSSTSLFPPGVRLNADTGRLTGRPTRKGTYRVVVTATDSFGGSTVRRLVIVVR